MREKGREVSVVLEPLVFEVVTMGSATQDVFAKSDADTVTIKHHGESEKMLAYPLGTKILITDLEFQVGGGGTNAAASFAKQGLTTGYLGKVGTDGPGQEVQRFLKRNKISFLGVVEGQTGYSVILDSQEDDRTILTFKGCNNDLREAEIKDTLAALQTRWLYCSSMLGESADTMQAVMRHVKERDGKVAFNPSSYQAAQGLGTLQRFLDHVDVLILNKEEAELLVGKQSTEVRELSRVLAAAGPDIVIITLGKGGVFLFDRQRYLHARPSKRLKIVETTGAGDAFGSGFVAGLAKGLSAERALRLGMLNAENVITAYGAKNNILTAAEMERALATDERELNEEKL